MPASIPIAADRRRVVVTGVGLVTTLGRSCDEIRNRLAGGEVAASRPVTGAPGLRLATIDGFEARPHFRQPKALKLTDRKTQLAVAAAAMAVADAGLAGDAERDDWAIVLGCSASDLQSAELARALAGAGPETPERAVDDLRLFAERILGKLNPLWLLVNLPNMVGAHVGIQLASHGPNHTLTGDWIAGTQALGEAYLAIAGGERELALAGGADAPLDPFDLGCLATRQTSDGGPPFTVAEGAAVWVLEERGHARRRGARELGEIRSYASAAAIDGDLAGAIQRAATAALAGVGEAADAPARALVASAAHRATLASRESQRRFGHALAASGPIEGALWLAELAEEGGGEPAAAGLLLAVGTLGQCAALRLTGPVRI